MKMKSRSVAGLCVVSSLLVFIPMQVSAAGGTEVKVAGRTISFLENAPSGKVTFAIVFDPSKAASVAEKDEVMAAIGSGITVGSTTIVGRPVEAGAVGGAGDVVAFYITHGVNYAAVGAVAKAKKILSISSDMACVNSGACAMGVATTPAVEIVVNKATASACGASFKSAFKMMIKEV